MPKLSSAETASERSNRRLSLANAGTTAGLSGGSPRAHIDHVFGAAGQLIFGSLAHSRDDPGTWGTNLPTGKHEADFGVSKLIEPLLLGTPWHEQVLEEHLAIYNTEFRVVDTIVPLQIALAWLHGWDNNPASQLSEPRIRMCLKWSS